MSESSSDGPMVVMDIGGVLISTVATGPYRVLAEITGGEWQRIATTIRRSGIVAAFGTGRLSGSGFADAVRELLDRPDLGDDDIREAWNTIVADADPITTPVAARLAESGRLVLASNTDPFHWPIVKDRLAAAGIEAPACLSFEIGHDKPAADFYECLTSRHPAVRGAPFVDDLAENIAAAKRHGFAGFHHTDPGTTATYLAGLLDPSGR